MIDHYQPFLFPFFSFRATFPNPLVKRYYYWSWEDGLWDVLQAKQVEKGSVLLIPNFYCSDVVENIRTHGYTVVFYRLDKHFQVKQRTLTNSIRRHHPKAVVIFHAAGIRSTVMNRYGWIRTMTQKTILIEDCVHQLVDPSAVKLASDNHFVLDSLRKVSPFYGSFLYGTKKGMRFRQAKTTWSLYSIRASVLFLVFRFILMTAHLLEQPAIAVFAHEKLLKTHDALIGDSQVAHRGIAGISWMTQWLNRSKVERMKREQVKWYEHFVKPLCARSSPFYQIKMKRSDHGKLHVYPVGVRRKVDPELLTYLKKKKIVVWPKFPDSVWARHQDVLFFPLGFHMDKQKVKTIAHALRSWKTGEWKQAKEAVQMSSPHLLVRAAQIILSF